MANRKIYSDENGIFIKHKNRKFRPDINRNKDTETNREVKMFENALKKSKEFAKSNISSSFSLGTNVSIEPISENEINVIHENEKEYWVEENTPDVRTENIKDIDASEDKNNSMDFLKSLTS